MIGRILSAACLAMALAPEGLTGTATVVLPDSATTSAGVFDSSGRLVRTLWSGRVQKRGAVVLDWNGLDDDGAPVPAEGTYTARVAAHNVRYVWEGVIGNTSAELTGPHVHRALGPIRDMAIDGAGHAFYVVGYNEQQSGLHRFEASDPQRPTVLEHDDYRRIFRYVATDGMLTYFANIGLHSPRGAFNREPSTFVIALRTTDNSEFRFPQGKVDTPPGFPGNRWENVIDYDRDDVDAADGTGFRSAPSGLAVQQRGNALFVAHQWLDEVRVLDKSDGALIDRIKVSRPTSIAIAPDDSLWVLGSADQHPQLTHFRLEASHWAASEKILSNLVRPLAIGVSPADGTVLVADADSEQLKALDQQGHLLWTLGEPNGYRNRPEVSFSRFWLSADDTYIAYEADGSFWFGDPGNSRDLHFSAQRHYLEQIMYLPVSYHLAVDPAAPSRVFSGYLEFVVDYTAPIQRSWRLVRNWAAPLGPAGVSKLYLGDLDGFRSVVTLSNGHTYGVVPRYDTRKSELVELTREGFRPVGFQFEFGSKLYPDGSLRSERVHLPSVQVETQTLLGFDDAANPRWAPPEVLASVANVRASDPYYHDVPAVGGVNEPTFPITDGDVVVIFNPGPARGYHLGGIRKQNNSWLWRASPSGSWNLDAEGKIVAPDGTFEVGRGVQYSGSVPLVSGRNILYGYYGEAWNAGQANQWLHFLDNGLFIGQFGQPVYPSQNKVFAHAESAGNAFSATVVSVDHQLYLWHNDESVHGGVHRWRIDGANQIKVFDAPIRP